MNQENATSDNKKSILEKIRSKLFPKVFFEILLKIKLTNKEEKN